MPLWIVYALGSALFASLVAIFGKLGVQNVDSTVATTVRAVIMAVFLVIVAVALGKTPLLSQIHNKALLFIVLSGIAGALSWLCYFYALKTGPIAGVVGIDKLSLVFAVILATLFLAEKITLKTGIGAVLVTVGAILMSLK